MIPPTDPAVALAAAVAAKAAQDAALMAQIIALITLVITSVTSIILAWIAFKQNVLTKAMVTLEKNTNSIKDALVEATAQKSHAEGRLEGIAITKAKEKEKDG